MDRTEYLNRMAHALYCVANKLPIPQEALVEHKGLIYYPYEYTMTSDGTGNFVHYAVLHDLRANSTTRAKLDKVKEFSTDDKG